MISNFLFSGTDLEASGRLQGYGQQLPAVLHFAGDTHPSQANYLTKTPTCQYSEKSGGEGRESTGKGGEGV